MYSTAGWDCGPPVAGHPTDPRVRSSTSHPSGPSDPRGTRVSNDASLAPADPRAPPAGRAATDPRDPRRPRDPLAAPADPNLLRGAGGSEPPSSGFPLHQTVSTEATCAANLARLKFQTWDLLRSLPPNQPLKMSSLHTAFLRRHRLQLQVAIREALGEAKAKEQTIEVQKFVKKYLADVVEMKRGRDLGTQGFEHQELYLFPRESFAQTASAYAAATTANAIDRSAGRDAGGGEAPAEHIGGHPAEDNREGAARIRRRETGECGATVETAVETSVHQATATAAPAPARAAGPLSKRPRTAVDTPTYCATCDCNLPPGDGKQWRIHAEGARHRANLAAARNERATRPISPPAPTRAAADTVSIDPAPRVERESSRAGIPSAAELPAPEPPFAPTTASVWADRVAGLADELLDARRAQRDANRALEEREREIATLRESTASFFADLKREAEAERRVCAERARAAAERAERAEAAESSAERRAFIAEESCRALADDLSRIESDRRAAEEETIRARDEAKALREASARLELELAASHVRLRAAEAPVGIAAAAGAPRVAGGGTSAGFRIPRVDEPPPPPPPPKPEPAPECCVCSEEYTAERVRHMFVGCQHVCVCGECADVIWKQGPNKRACPICREKVKHRAIPFRPVFS